MEYYSSINQLPDASSSNEKALMWSSSQFMGTESGYSTQAPSISSIDNFLNNEAAMPQQQVQTAAQAIVQQQQQQQQQQQPQETAVMQPAPQPVYEQLHPPGQPQQQQPTTASIPAQQTAKQQQDQSSDNNNAVANWMNYQDDSEMALKAIPELLKLLVDEDLVVVQQAAILFNQMSRNEGPRMAIIQTHQAVQCLVDCLNRTADLDTARSIVGTLYSVSTQKQAGVQRIVESKAMAPLVKMLSAPMETIVSYAITTIHNILLDCDNKVKAQLRAMGTIHQMIPLMHQTTNVKFLSIVIDCLQLLAFGHQESKQVILELGGTQMLVQLLMNSQGYHKLLLNCTRLLKVLSVCAKNKHALIQLNAMQALGTQLLSTTTVNGLQTTVQASNDILNNCLITLRNLSDAATRLQGLEPLVQNLCSLLSLNMQPGETSVSILVAGILSNLTCNNEQNKKTALKSNVIRTLLQLIQCNLTQRPQLVEPCVCALRHVTNRHADMLLAQEQLRQLNGMHVITQLMCVQPRNWPCIKATLGLVRNFCSNQLNSQQLRSNYIIEKLMQVLYDAYTEVQLRMGGPGPVKIDDVNMLDIIESSAAALLTLAKDYQNQLIMKELDCLGFFVQMFFSQTSVVQRVAAALLAELSTSPECAECIDQQPGLHPFVQANFCNQFGMLKTIAELSSQQSSGSNATIVLQHVTTLMQRLQEHKNKRTLMQQQQQQQQQMNGFGAQAPQTTPSACQPQAQQNLQQQQQPQQAQAPPPLQMNQFQQAQTQFQPPFDQQQQPQQPPQMIYQQQQQQQQHQTHLNNNQQHFNQFL